MTKVIEIKCEQYSECIQWMTKDCLKSVGPVGVLTYFVVIETSILYSTTKTV